MKPRTKKAKKNMNITTTPAEELLAGMANPYVGYVILFRNAVLQLHEHFDHFREIIPMDLSQDVAESAIIKSFHDITGNLLTLMGELSQPIGGSTPENFHKYLASEPYLAAWIANLQEIVAIGKKMDAIDAAEQRHFVGPKAA